MRVLITGGAGFLGSSLWAYLKDQGHEVWGIDDFRGSTPPVVDADHFLKENVRADAASALVARVNPDVIVHMAATSSPAYSMEHPLETWENNLGGLAAVLAWPGAEHRRLIFSSTGAVYDQGYATENGLRETSPVGPANHYGRTKLVGEWRIEAGKSYRSVVIFRYFVVTGAYRDKQGRWWGERRPNDNHLFPAIMDVALGKKDKVMVHGGKYPTSDGTCLRDFVHVKDLIDAHDRVIQSSFSDRIDRYNIGTGQGFSILETIQMADRVLGKSIPYEIGPIRTGDPHTLIGNIDYISGRLGWSPKCGLREMIQDEFEFRKWWASQ